MGGALKLGSRTKNDDVLTEVSGDEQWQLFAGKEDDHDMSTL